MNITSKINLLLYVIVQQEPQKFLEYIPSSYLKAILRIARKDELRANLLAWAKYDLASYSKPTNQYLIRIEKEDLLNDSNAETTGLAIVTLITGFLANNITEKLRKKSLSKPQLLQKKGSNGLSEIAKWYLSRIGQHGKSIWTKDKNRHLPTSAIRNCNKVEVRAPNWNSPVIGTLPNRTEVIVLREVHIPNNFSRKNPGCNSNRMLQIQYTYGRNQTFKCWVLSANVSEY